MEKSIGLPFNYFAKYILTFDGIKPATNRSPEHLRGGSICNVNPYITPSKNALGFNAICQAKDQSVAVLMMHETLFYLSKFNMLQAF